MRHFSLMYFLECLILGLTLNIFSAWSSSNDEGRVVAIAPIKEMANFENWLSNDIDQNKLEQFNTLLKTGHFPSAKQLIYLFESYDANKTDTMSAIFDLVLMAIFNPAKEYGMLRENLTTMENLNNKNTLPITYLGDTLVTPIGIIFRKNLTNSLDKFINFSSSNSLRRQIFAELFSDVCIKRDKFNTLFPSVWKEEANKEEFTPGEWLIRNNFKKINVNSISHQMALKFIPLMGSKLKIEHFNYATYILNTTEELFHQLVEIAHANHLSFYAKQIIFPNKFKHEDTFIKLMNEKNILSIDVELDSSLESKKEVSDLGINSPN